MYENQTVDTIQKRMLGNVPTDVDQREGSIIYDSVRPSAIEFMMLYTALDFFLTNTFGDTADREYLIERAKERGLTPKEATKAKVKGVFTPSLIDVPIGSVFSYDDLNYEVIQKLSQGVYILQCETAGVIGNKPSGKLIPNTYIIGLETAEMTEVTVPGEDDEDTEVFRARYLASFDSQAYGGNITDYKEKVGAISGVGGLKVYPVWDGGGSVKIVFMTSEAKPPTSEFITEVQTALDPVKNQGLGVGIAPIGHTVTVCGASDSSINITLKVSTASSLDDYKEAIQAIIDDYFEELNRTWPDTAKYTTNEIYNNGLVVRISQIESRILELDGVDDISHTKLNGVEENLTLGLDELAVRGEITWA